MRIALVHMRHSGTGGTERYLNQMSTHLAERGHDVTVVCRSHERSPHPAIRFVVLRDAAIGSTWRLWAFAQAVQRHVAASRYDVVYGLGKTWSHDVIRLGGGCHESYLDAMHPTPWGRRLAGWRLKHRVAVAIERRALRAGAYARVVTNSEMVKCDAAQRHRIPNEHITVIYNGVDLQRFHPQRHGGAGGEIRRACGFSSDDFVVLFLGTGYRRKGLARLLQSFARLAHERPEARLLVVGYDSAQRSYERLATRLGIAPRVRFAGGRRDAEACFAAANVYVLPTRYDPFANSTLEALASGLPVITTSGNGGAEILSQRTTGSIIEPGDDVDSLLEELRFWAEGRRARAAGVAARALAERYPQEKTVEDSTALLESCVRK